MQRPRRRIAGSAGSSSGSERGARDGLGRRRRRARSSVRDRVAAETSEQRVGEDEATIASPTTAAAGTAQTSLRSIAAGDSCHRRQIDGSQRLHQRRDRLHPAGDAQVLAVGDAAFEAAGVVGRPRDTGRCVRPTGRGTISSCTRDPGRAATSGPRPMPTALIAGIDISACARRPSSLRSHCT